MFFSEQIDPIKDVRRQLISSDKRQLIVEKMLFRWFQLTAGYRFGPDF